MEKRKESEERGAEGRERQGRAGESGGEEGRGGKKLAILLIVSLFTFLIAVHLGVRREAILSGSRENNKICDDQGERI